MKKAIAIHPKDNVATLLNEAKSRELVTVQLGDDSFELTASEDLHFGHKIALAEIRNGENVIKYGEVIGQATADIPPGTLVHIHNVGSLRGRGDLS